MDENTMQPLSELALVEFPGVLSNPKDPSKAIAALGGEQAVRNSIAMPFAENAPPLTLNLRPGYNNSPSNIVAEKPNAATNLFLLRIDQNESSATKPTELNADANEQHDDGASAVIQGQITSVTSFKAISDFQFHSNIKLGHLNASNTTSSASKPTVLEQREHSFRRLEDISDDLFQMLKQHPNSNSNEDINVHIDKLRPSRFARGLQEYGNASYWFRQYGMHNDNDDSVTQAMTGKGAFGEDRRSDAKRLDALYYRVPLDVDNVPTHPDPSFAPPVQRGREAFDTLYEMMSKLFEERPIWIRRALFQLIPDELKKSFKRVICMIAYCFQGTGPFFQAWIRYGYDPRKDIASRKYQVLEIRFNNPAVLAAVKKQAEKARQAKEGEMQEQDKAEAEDNMLSHLPFQKNNFIQICDIKLKQVAQFCNEEPFVPIFDKKFGFFSKEAYHKLLEIIRGTIASMSEDILGKEECAMLLRDYRYKAGPNKVSVKRKQPRMRLKPILQGGAQAGSGPGDDGTAGRSSGLKLNKQIANAAASTEQGQAAPHAGPEKGADGTHKVPEEGTQMENEEKRETGADEDEMNDEEGNEDEMNDEEGNENEMNDEEGNEGAEDSEGEGEGDADMSAEETEKRVGSLVTKDSGQADVDLEEVEGYEIFGDDGYEDEDEDEDDEDFDDGEMG